MSHAVVNYLSVGIDVGSNFSVMTIVDPNQKIVQKSFKIHHNKIDSLKLACLKYKKQKSFIP